MSENTVREDPTYDENTEPVEAHESVANGGETAPTTRTRPPGPRGPSASTVVLGLMFAVVAALLLGHQLDLFEVDPVTSGVWLLMGSGALLVIWALISMVGKRGDGAQNGD
jgi:hypothetical protein